MMRVIRTVVASLVALAIPAAIPPATAAQLDNALLSGTTMGAGANAEPNVACTVDLGPTTFQREGTGKAHISFTSIKYFDDTIYHLAGLALLRFDTSTSGVAIFDFVGNYPAVIRRPRFTNYSQLYRSARGSLTVSFDLHLDDCVLPVTAIYRH